MNTEKLKRCRKERLISLNASETLALTKPEEWTNVEINVDNGISRIGTNSNDTLDDTTLAFACRTEPCIFTYPDELSIKLESISDSSFSIKYNREEHLLPLILIFSKQGLGQDEGASLDYQLEEIEKTLGRQILGDKTPINVAIKHFLYKGELRMTGDVAKFSNIIDGKELAANMRIDSEASVPVLLFPLSPPFCTCISRRSPPCPPCSKSTPRPPTST